MNQGIKIFLKWTLSGFIMLLLVMIGTFLTSEINYSRIPFALLYSLIGAILLGLFFYFLEIKVVPWRHQIVVNKLIKTYDGKLLGHSIIHFTLENFDFYAQLDITLSMSQAGGYLESIGFHIPQEQIDRLPIKPDFKFTPSFCFAKKTYLVFQGSGYSVKRSRKQLNKRLRR